MIIKLFIIYYLINIHYFSKKKYIYIYILLLLYIKYELSIIKTLNIF